MRNKILFGMLLFVISFNGFGQEVIQESKQMTDEEKRIQKVEDEIRKIEGEISQLSVEAGRSKYSARTQAELSSMIQHNEGVIQSIYGKGLTQKCERINSLKKSINQYNSTFDACSGFYSIIKNLESNNRWAEREIVKVQEKERLAEIKRQERIAKQEEEERLAEIKREEEIAKQEEAEREKEESEEEAEFEKTLDEAREQAEKEAAIKKKNAKEMREMKKEYNEKMAEAEKDRLLEKQAKEDRDYAAARRNLAKIREEERQRVQAENRRNFEEVGGAAIGGMVGALASGNSMFDYVRFSMSLRSTVVEDEDYDNYLSSVSNLTYELGLGGDNGGFTMGVGFPSKNDYVDEQSGWSWVIGLEMNLIKEEGFLFGINGEFGMSEEDTVEYDSGRSGRKTNSENGTFYTFGVQVTLFEYLYLSYNYGFYKGESSIVWSDRENKFFEAEGNISSIGFGISIPLN
jgi:hypothetical protein